MARNESVLYSFPTGSKPLARPYQDPANQLYVPAYTGDRTGTMVQISENHGKWKGLTIFQFSGNAGEKPAAGLTADPNGVLYGTTEAGGTDGAGTIYSLALIKGVWTETVLYNFTGGADGAGPDMIPLRDTLTGALYGTMASGGNSGCGSVFSLVPSGENWTFNLLYSFAGGSDGCTPTAGLHAGAKSGTYFGITTAGGTGNNGTVYELTEENGIWSETVIHSFTGGNDGIAPADLDVDQNSGGLFGVTSLGGVSGEGTVFGLTEARHRWTETVLFSFDGSDGARPFGLYEEKDTGTLFGTTEFGGDHKAGTLFQLSKSGSGWNETVLHSFGASVNDGANPQSRPYQDRTTNYLYGTTQFGGNEKGGTVYKFVP